MDAPAALSDVGELDGLDARNVWPPLLRPNVLMDLESYGAWERLAIQDLTRTDTCATPRDALASLADVTARISSWTPGSGELLDVVHAAFPPRPGAATTPGDGAAVRRWLAARLFGAWIAYQGNGLAATIAYLQLCLETFEREVEIDGSALEAIRRSDLKIVHGSMTDSR